MNAERLLDMLMQYQSSVRVRAMTPDEAKTAARTVSRVSMVKALDEYIDERIMRALRRNGMAQE